MSQYSIKKKAISIMLSALTCITFAGCSQENSDYYNPRAIVSMLDDENPEMKDSKYIIREEALNSFPLFEEINLDKDRVNKAFYGLRCDYDFSEAYNFLNHYLDFLEKNKINDVYSCMQISKKESGADIIVSYKDEKKDYQLSIIDLSTFKEKNEIVTENVMTDNIIFIKYYDFKGDIPAGEKKVKDPYGKWSISYTILLKNLPNYTVTLTNDNYLKKINNNFINQGNEYFISLYKDGEEIKKERIERTEFVNYLDSMNTIYQVDPKENQMEIISEERLYRFIQFYGETQQKNKY